MCFLRIIWVFPLHSFLLLQPQMDAPESLRFPWDGNASLKKSTPAFTFIKNIVKELFSIRWYFSFFWKMSQICIITCFSSGSTVFHESTEQNSGLKKESAQQYSANFHYFCEMGWCVLLLPCIYIQYCYCQISETEKAYLCLRHMSSRISLSKNILMYSLYCKHTTEIMPTWDIMKFAFAL